ncbi:MAG: hypothetical protein S4CHLAM27_09970 [Chlamydiia bacterium]|nr:hypothetical protein [Chlamydiia bacterium]
MVSIIGLSAGEQSKFIPSNEGLKPLGNYISGSAFRGISDFTYEELHVESWEYSTPIAHMRGQMNNIIQNIETGDIVFVQVHLLDDFLEKVHPHIECRYILITHNGDSAVDKKYLALLDDPKIIKWYAQNVNLHHEKLIPIPIGIENRYWYKKRTSDENLLAKIANLSAPRANVTYLNIALHTFQEERSFVHNLFSKQRFVVPAKKKRFPDYLKDLKRSRFCLSPSGNGIDCHRTWEALLMGCIPVVRPIVKDTKEYALGNEFLYKDLPVIMIKEWSEVTEDFLERKLEELSRKEMDLTRLYFPYWRDLILKEAELAKASPQGDSE